MQWYLKAQPCNSTVHYTHRLLHIGCRANAKHWVYPATVPERAYQVDIIKTALLQNTLVCLPTGLGKTLIAAVLMYNFTRWFPEVLLLFHCTCSIGDLRMLRTS